MPDITICCNNKCNQNTECYRFMAVSTSHQSFAKFQPLHSGHCDHKIKIQPGYRLTKTFEDKETK